MAYVTLIRNSTVHGAAFPYFYNVHRAVGPGRPNQHEDVLLVQYFLKSIYDHPNATNPPLHPPFGSKMVVDGVAGPITFSWIKHFQAELQSRGQSIVVDGIVNPAVGSFAGPSGSTYTIVRLSAGFLQARPADYPNISKAGDCPPMLGAAVSV